jgi:CHASE2 domain-containing sensor protein
LKIITFIKKILAAFSISLVILFTAYALKEILSIIKKSDFSENLIFFQPDISRNSTLQFISKFKDHTPENTPIDSNLIIINIESPNAFLKRGEMASVIRFLKDAGAKTIALDLALDITSTEYNPSWDHEFSEAIKYANNVISINALNTFLTDNEEIDTVIGLQPLPIFDTVLKDKGYANLDPPYSRDNPGGVVQYFYPNQDFKGNLQRSFAMSVVNHYDNSKTIPFINYTEKIYNNFYSKSSFTIWDLSLLSNKETNILFKDYIKNRLFVFGYINPEDDPLKTSMFTTPIGKLDYVLVYAGIINDLLKSNYKAIHIIPIDYFIGLFLIFFNIIYFHYTRYRKFKLKKIINILLLPSEVALLSLVITFLYFSFNILINIIIPFLAILISVPLVYYFFYRLEVYFKRIMVLRKDIDLPFLFYTVSLEPYKNNNSVIRYLTMIYNFRKLFTFLNIVSGVKIENSQDGKDIKYNYLESLKNKDNKYIKSVKELEQINENGSEINNRVLAFLKTIRKPELIDEIINKEYNNLFTTKNLTVNIMDLSEANENKFIDNLNNITMIYHDIIHDLARLSYDFSLVHITKRNGNKYLIQSFGKNSPCSEYKVISEDLNVKELYVFYKNKYITLHPLIIYKFCPFHHQKEIFILNSLTTEKISDNTMMIYSGNNFCCRLEAPARKIMPEDLKCEKKL